MFGEATAEHYGRGPAHPLAIGPTGGVQESAGVARVEQSIRIILGTQHGERMMRPRLRRRPRDPGVRPQQRRHRQPRPLLVDDRARPVGAAHRGARREVQRRAASTLVDDRRYRLVGATDVRQRRDGRSPGAGGMTAPNGWNCAALRPRPARPDPTSTTGPGRTSSTRLEPSSRGTRRSGPTATPATSASRWSSCSPGRRGPDLPAQPRPGEELRRVPEPRRHHPDAAAALADLLALTATRRRRSSVPPGTPAQTLGPARRSPRSCSRPTPR